MQERWLVIMASASAEMHGECHRRTATRVCARKRATSGNRAEPIARGAGRRGTPAKGRAKGRDRPSRADSKTAQTGMRGDRIPSLDGLRAISIALVLLSHLLGPRASSGSG